VHEWRNAAPTEPGSIDREHWLIDKAAQWGADQGLEACRAFLLTRHGKDYGLLADALRAARRPKQPGLKEQALLQLDTLNADLAMHGRGCDLSQIRRALEQLDD
jgi:hypothetical protein